MNTNVDELEVLYKKIYEISVQISQLIERKIYSELITFINKKDQLYKEADLLVEKIKESGEDASLLSDICKKINNQERENITALNSIKDEIRNELKKTSQNNKIANAYSGFKTEQGNILDFSE